MTLNPRAWMCLCRLLIPGRRSRSLSQSKNNELGFKLMALQTADSDGVLCAMGFWLLEPRGFVFSSFFPAIMEAGSFLSLLNHR